MINREVLKKMERERTIICSVRKRQLKSLWNVMRKRGLENLSLTGYIECKRGKRKELVAYLTSICKSSAE